MHGLINRSIQCFVRDTYGPATWAAVAREARISQDGYEAMLTYAPGLTGHLITACHKVLGHPRDTMLEDLGTYLVSHQNMEALRRLLRFSGVDYVEFLHSLPDLRERARLAVSDLDLPELHLTERGEGLFTLTCGALLPGTGHVLLGLLRAMADDYGALVLLDHEEGREGGDVISIHLLEQGYAKGRQFDLAVRTG